MKQRLDIAVKPELGIILTPELQLSFELLTAPVLEVKRIIDEELMTNPFLEEMPKEKFESPVDGEEEQPWWERLPAPAKTVEEHLIEQIEVLPEVGEKEKKIMRELVLLLDEKGYLNSDYEAICEKEKISPEELERIRKKMMESLDPLGCGSKSFEEFFELQLKFFGVERPSAVFKAEELIKKLREKGYVVKPYPFWGLASGEDFFVEPDAYVVKVGAEYQVFLNEKWIPRLVFNEEYRTLARSPDLDEQTRKFLTEKMKRALAMLKAIEQRNKTLRKTVEAIVDLEREFLEKGPAFLKPLSLKDVAEKVDLHISTVSRVVNSKYVHTPQGTFPLKFFFEDKAFVIKKRIKELIKSEDKRKPLSDREIAEILKREGFDIARRTVAKYREELGIPSSSKRRVRR